MKILYEENDNVYYRDKKGRIKKAPKNKYEHNEIVTTTEKHFSQKNITRLQYPTYNDSRGWVYTENYINEQGRGGGCGSWNEEAMYEKITDPKFIMIAKRIELKEEIKGLKKRLGNLNSELDKLEFAMDLSVPMYQEATDSCNLCGTLFKGFDGGNPNWSLCDNCIELKEKK